MATDVIKVQIVQVNMLPRNLRDLDDAVARGRTDDEGWQIVKSAAPGDLVVWYGARRKLYVARGWVEGHPWKIGEGEVYGRYRALVAGVQAFVPPVDAVKIKQACGVDGGSKPGPQTVPDRAAVEFLRLLGLFP